MVFPCLLLYLYSLYTIVPVSLFVIVPKSIILALISTYTSHEASCGGMYLHIWVRARSRDSLHQIHMHVPSCHTPLLWGCLKSVCFDFSTFTLHKINQALWFFPYLEPIYQLLSLARARAESRHGHSVRKTGNYFLAFWMPPCSNLKPLCYLSSTRHTQKHLGIVLKEGPFSLCHHPLPPKSISASLYRLSDSGWYDQSGCASWLKAEKRLRLEQGIL